MMGSLMEKDDWALQCSWPPVGNQWQYSVDQFFEPFELLGNKSDDAECQLFNDDITVQQHGFSSVWSNSSLFMEDTFDKNASATSYLMSTPEHVSDGMEMVSSPLEELPSSPETFRAISTYELYGESDNHPDSWQQELYFTEAVSSQSPVFSDLSDTFGRESADVATVPECELSAEDMLLDLDEALSDVIMNPLKLVDIGLYLPPVSADDVDFLLSSSTVATVPPAAEPVSLDIATIPLKTCEVYHDQRQAANPLVSDMEASVTVDSFPVFQDQIQASSPLASETELSSVSSACSPAYEQHVQVPSPASSQSSVSMSADRKQRKKQQNKTAAQKYRQKKHGEQGLVITEYEQLERRNIELRTRVEEMTREVDYLKGLIEEICS